MIQLKILRLGDIMDYPDRPYVIMMTLMRGTPESQQRRRLWDDRCRDWRDAV